MQRVHKKVRSAIFSILDIFYPVFRRFLPLQTYHYAACGGVNTVLGLVVYFVAHNYIVNKHVLDIGLMAFKPHIAAMFISFLFTFPVGFYLSMYVIFQGSYLRKRVQLFRYFIVIMFCMLINYVCLKIFVEYFGWYPTPSQIITTGVVILFNYFSQRHFSFRKDKKALEAEGIQA